MSIEINLNVLEKTIDDYVTNHFIDEKYKRYIYDFIVANSSDVDTNFIDDAFLINLCSEITAFLYTLKQTNTCTFDVTFTLV